MNASRTHERTSTNTRITVCLIEEEPRYRAQLERWLEGAEEFQCVGSHSDASEAADTIEEKKPCVIVLDYGLPGMRGDEVLYWLKRIVPQIKVLVLTGIRGEQVIFDSLEAGADGFLDKEGLTQTQFLAEIRAAFAGQHPLSEHAQKVLWNWLKNLKPSLPVPVVLTECEQKVADLLSRGLSDKQIAAAHGVSVPTIRTHLQHVFSKLKVQSRTEAIVKLLHPE